MFLPEQNEDPKKKAIEFFKKFGLPLEDVDDLVEAVMVARNGGGAESKEEDDDGDEDDDNDSDEDEDEDNNDDEPKAVDVC